MIVKDSMVLIHLAKLTLLESSCKYFKKVIIPTEVFNEITKEKEKGFTDAIIIEEIVQNKKIQVIKIENKELIERANQFNIQRGEAEALALYWQEKAEYLATDDDNVRKKSFLLNINIIGTPAIILKLYKEKIVSKEKIKDSLDRLRKIGWFSNIIIDKILMEVDKK